MDSLERKIKNNTKEVTYESLLNFIKSLNLNEINYDSYVYEPETVGDYGRNILTLEPFECVLINWPPSVESAVHLHKGLFGYVCVLEGELDNVFYEKRRTN